MKIVRSALFRALCAVIIGVLLVIYPEQATNWLVIAIGALFIVPGLVMLVAYLLSKPNDGHKPIFPVGSLGSLLLGLLLVSMPNFFVTWLMFLLGGLLVLAGAAQIAQLVGRAKQFSISLGYYILPVLVLLSGLFILFNPLESASIPFIILGVCHIVYGLSEMINILKFRVKEIKEEPSTVEVVDETKEIPYVETEEVE